MTDAATSAGAGLPGAAAALARFVTEAPVAVAILDAGMRYLAWSQAWARQFGLPTGGLAGRSHRDLFPGHALDWDAAVRRGLAGQATDCEEAEVQLPDGREVWLRWCIRPIPLGAAEGSAVAVFAEDITDRRQAKAELQRAADRLQQIATSLGIGIFDHDVATGRTTVSDSHVTLLGLTREALPVTTADWIALMRPVDMAAYRAARKRALDPRGDGRFSCEVRPVVAGVERVMEVQARVLFQGEGDDRRPERLVGVTVDQTERRRLHEALSRAQKLETVGRLAGMVAHDFNNILTVILANLELAALREVDDNLRLLLRNAADAAEMGAGFTKRLLALAGGAHRDEGSAVAIDDHIGRVWDVFQRVLNDSIAFRFHPGARDAVVAVDTAEIDGAILNLVMNARDAQAEGGQIDLRTELVTLDETQASAIRGGRPGRFVRIAVRDRGPGVPPEVAARLGEPFLTTKGPGRGSGLGLTSVILTVERAGGFLQVVSDPGEGTEMALHLPALDSPPQPPTAASQDYPFGNGELVLVVEDDPMVREAALLRLEAIGYAVIEAGNAEAALALVEAGEPVDLVFSDVVMPGALSGFDLVRELRARHPGIAVLLTSGHVSTTIRSRAGLDPPVPLLTKPYPLQALAEAVAAALRSVPSKA